MDVLNSEIIHLDSTNDNESQSVAAQFKRRRTSQNWLSTYLANIAQIMLDIFNGLLIYYWILLSKSEMTIMNIQVFRLKTI